MNHSRSFAALLSLAVIVGLADPVGADGTDLEVPFDNTAPVVTATLTATQTGANGWSTGAVGLAWSVDDSTATLSGECADGQYSGDGEYSLTCTATDAAGNAGSATAAFKIDGTKPVIGSTVSGPLGSNGWYRNEVAVTWTIGDVTSGIDAAHTVGCVNESVLPTTGTYTRDCSVTDNAGNSASDSISFKIDMVYPEIDVVLDSAATPTIHGWHAAPVSVRWFVSDEGHGSGIASTVGCEDEGPYGEGAHSVSCFASDAAGNSIMAYAWVQVDMTPPTLTGTAGTPTGTNGWFRSPTRVDWTVFDAGSGFDPSSRVGCLESLILTDGVWTQTCKLADKAGHVVEKSVVVKVDRTPPVVTCPSADSAWLADNITVACTVQDATSGPLANPVLLSTSVAAGIETTTAYTGTGQARDLAGNFVLLGAQGPFAVDRKAPVDVAFVGGPPEGSEYDFGSVPAAPTCTAADGGSGLARCTVSGYATTAGTHTMTATATDNVGNSESITRTYTVKGWTLSGFYQPVDMGGVWNTVKSGATVPLSFEIFVGQTEITDTAGVQGFAVKPVTCPGASAPSDDVEFTTTGNTVLHYDASSGRFVQKWQTPKKAGGCYAVTMTTVDGSSLSANVKLK